MAQSRVTSPRHFFGVASKFAVVVAITAVSLAAVAGVALSGLGRMAQEIDKIYTNNIRTSQLTTDLESSLDDAAESALQLILTDSSISSRRLEADLTGRIVPAVDRAIEALRAAHAEDPEIERARVERINTGWRKFVRLFRSGRLAISGTSATTFDRKEALGHTVANTFVPITSLASEMADVEAAQARRARDRALQIHRNSRGFMSFISLVGLVLSLAAVVGLTRNIVPRLRDYSHFARRVAAGDQAGRVSLKGHDEIRDLGAALNDMVTAGKQRREYDETQGELAETMQATETEQEAYGLLKRHLERSISEANVTVLNRNNSENRLEATTAIPPDSPLKKSLEGATPRSCLAVRMGRGHHEGGEREPLLSCDVCSRICPVTCEPLLVGGEVIGSVLVDHTGALDAMEQRRIEQSVTQAAPLLANLRNLAIAQVRAGTDALTGLPNNRSVQDSLKRMVAQASRSLSPLAAVLLDLDHFKQINDTYGHGHGDDVLAAVGTTLKAGMRESDFVGRYGGEEFVMLLPGTDREGAAALSEKIRVTISELAVPRVDRRITASFGVAVLPDDAYDADMLIRNADRALYAAKSNGRNRVEGFSPHQAEEDQGTLASPADGGPIVGAGTEAG